jgi:hypothetical protein
MSDPCNDNPTATPDACGHDLAASGNDTASRREFLRTSAGLAAGVAAAPMLSASALAQGGAADADAELVRVQGQRRILLRGGVVLSLDRQVGDFAQADVLIEDGKTRAMSTPSSSRARCGSGAATWWASTWRACCGWCRRRATAWCAGPASR